MGKHLTILVSNSIINYVCECKSEHIYTKVSKKIYEVIILNKRITSFLMVLLLLFSFCGCDADFTAETNANKTQVELTDSESKQGTDSPTDKPSETPEITSDNGLMRVHFIDVGQADSTFIELGNGQTMLIDAGEPHNASTIIKYIKDREYSAIDFVIATHPHDDHIGGMAEVLNSFTIGKMYMPKQAHTISAFDNMLDAIENNGIELYTAKSGVNILTTETTEIDLLAPLADSYSNLNNVSAVVRIKYGETVMLFTGDAEQEIETQLLDSDVDADVLKVGHHGAGSSSAPSFIKEVSPKVAVISSGGEYGHPHSDTLAILKDVGADIYRTDEQGTIVVTADQNKKISVDKKASSVKENAPPSAVTKPSETVEDEPVVSDNQSQVVYRTRTGKKYHRAGCSYLKSIIETTVSEAQAMGLGPCSRCNPPR